MTRPYDLTTYDGRRVDELTKAALVDAARQLGYDLTLAQGSYNPGGVGASAGTHDGGGVVDLAPYEYARKVQVLRSLGFAAWYRPAIPGLWGAHIHAVLIGNRKLAPAARYQVAEYLAGRNGLANRGPDTGPRQYVNRRYRWRRGARRIGRARRLAERAAELLASGVRGYPIGAARRALIESQRRLPDVE